MENRRTSMRLREPAAKLRENDANVEQAQASPKTRPVGRPKGAKKAKVTAQEKAEVKEEVEEKIELAPSTITLPNKLVDGQPLPSLPTLQSRKLKDADWQSVADSGVLVASLPRSRQRWLHDGMFETYWSKSTYKKKKEQMLQDGGKGPQVKEARPSMTKIGMCKMVVEPHIFDVTMFVIKDPAASSPHVQYDKGPAPYGHNGTTNDVPQQQQHRHHMPSQPRPYTPSSSKPLYPAAQANQIHNAVNQPTYGPPTTNATATPMGMHPTQGFHHHPSRLPPADAQSNAYQPTATTLATAPNPAAAQLHSAPVTSNASRAGPTIAATRPSSAPKPPPPAQNGAPDPVIQMLAQRAQNDHALKQVMKLVAGGQASQAELNYFQGHIDELTKLVKQRQEEENRKKAQESKLNLNQSALASKQVQPGATSQHGTQNHNDNAAARHPTQNQHQSHRPVYHQPAVPVQPRPPRQVLIPPPLHVLLEFSQNSADRFLFPRHSILEFDAQRKSVLASFLVVKTLSQIQQRQQQQGDGPDGAPKVKRTYNKKKKIKDEDRAQDGTNSVGAATAAVATNGNAVPEASTTSAQTVEAVSQPLPPVTDTTTAGAESVQAASADATIQPQTSSPKAKAKGATPKKTSAKHNAEGQAETTAADTAAVAESKTPSKPEKQYYQPVSVRFEAASDPAVFTALSRVVAPIKDTQKYMMDVASKAERVPVSYLAMRLPREPKEIIL